MIYAQQRNQFECRLDDAVEAVERSWIEHGSCDLQAHMPNDLDPQDFAQIAIELMCVDMQYRWRQQERVTVAEYRRRFPEVFDDSVDIEPLVFEEYRMHLEAGSDQRCEDVGSTYGVDCSGWPTLAERQDDGGLERLDGALDLLESPHEFPRPGETWCEFELVEELGRGTFAVVYLARQTGLADREIVLKLTRCETVEPDLLARLQHTNIVPVYSVHGEGDPLRAICMPYFGRATLRDWITDSNAFSETQKLSVIRQIAQALAHAHKHGIVHRDIKPGNVLVADDGTAMLLDFNLSDDTVVGGQVGAVVGGTLPYLAPEQLRALQTGEAVGPAADLFSLGVVAHELLTGLRPFSDGCQPMHFDNLIDEMVSERSSVECEFATLDSLESPAIAALVRRLLQADPNSRYPSAVAVVEDLECHQSNRRLQHVENPSWRENLKKLRLRYPRMTSGLAVGTVASVMMIVLLAVMVAANGRYRRSQARLALSDLERFASEVRGELIAPLNVTDEETINATLAKLDEFGDAEQLASGQHPVATNLSPANRNRLGELLSDLLFLVSLNESRQAAREIDQQQRERYFEDALAHNRLAMRLRPSATCQALTLQESALLASLHGESNLPMGQVADQDNRDVAPAWIDAIWLIEHSQYQRAIDLLETLRDRDGRDPSVWLLLGNSYLGQERWAEATQCYSAYIALSPNSHVGFFYRGLSHFFANEYQASLHDMNRCLELNGSDTIILGNRAAVFKALGSVDRAEQDLTSALKLDDAPSRFYFRRAEIRGMLGDRVGAKEDRRLGLETTPTDAKSYVERGLALAKSEPQRAIEDFDSAIRLDPAMRIAYRNKAFVLGERLGDISRALAVLRKCYRLHQHGDDLASIAVYSAKQDDRVAAIAAAKQLVNGSPTSKQWFQLACVYSLIAVGDSELSIAVAYLEKSLMLEPRWMRFAMEDPDLEAVRSAEGFEDVIASAKRRLVRQAAIDSTAN